MIYQMKPLQVKTHLKLNSFNYIVTLVIFIKQNYYRKKMFN